MTDDTTTREGAFEKREDAGPGDAGTVKLWLAALQMADKEEEDWRKRGAEIWRRYRGDKKRGKRSRFNILRSNVKTIRPAIYNSAPKPDVRRRFGDADPVARAASQVLERCVSYGIDDGGFHSMLKACVNDTLVPGRGWAMVEYRPVFDDAGNVVDEEVVEKHVQWDDFRRGPAKEWSAVPWIAVRHYMTRSELVEKFGAKIGNAVQLDATVTTDKDDDGKPVSDVFKRAEVWQIWDKTRREILFIAKSYKDSPLNRVADPLKLQDFFPGPCPLYANVDSQSLVPVDDFNEYEEQANELDKITARIDSLISSLKQRGVYDATIEEMARLESAEDNALVPAENVAALINRGGLENAIWFMPIDTAAAVLNQLYVNREQVKQTIYEITGVSDILRGASDPNETLGAQQLKAEFGSNKLTERQEDVARFARDLIRLKAEIIAEHFRPETMAAQSGIQEALLPQVQALLRSDQLRGWRIDIETDSTIAADMSKARANIGEFVSGFAQYTQAVAPAVESGVMSLDVATDMLTGFARAFKLGKQVEDALERLGQGAQQQGQGQPGAAPQQPDPRQAAEAAQAEAEVAKVQQDAQVEQIEAQAKVSTVQTEAQLAQAEASLKIREHEVKMRELEMREAEMALEHEVKVAELQMRREQAALNAVQLVGNA